MKCTPVENQTSKTKLKIKKFNDYLCRIQVFPNPIKGESMVNNFDYELLLFIYNNKFGIIGDEAITFVFSEKTLFGMAIGKIKIKDLFDKYGNGKITEVTGGLIYQEEFPIIKDATTGNNVGIKENKKQSELVQGNQQTLEKDFKNQY